MRQHDAGFTRFCSAPYHLGRLKCTSSDDWRVTHLDIGLRLRNHVPLLHYHVLSLGVFLFLNQSVVIGWTLLKVVAN